MRLLLVSLCFLFTGAISAKETETPAQKKYKKEMSAVFANLEIVESSLPSAVVPETASLEPSFKLRNKSNREILVPLALGYPSERGGVLGYPVWRFEKASGGKQPVFRKGILAYAFKVEPGGLVAVGSSMVKGMSVAEMGLSPGDHKMTVTFYPFISIGTEALVSRVYKFTVVGAAQSKGGQSAGKPVEPKPATRRAAGPVLLGSVGLGSLEFATETVKAGTPLACTFDIVVDPSKPLPDEDPAGQRGGLNCSWTIFRLPVGKSANAKKRISGSIINVNAAAMAGLRENGAHTLRLSNDTNGLEQGDYELSVTLWEEDSQAKRTNGQSRSAVFRIAK